MIIAAIDSGLESLMRTALPLPHSLGDVSFDAPSGSWSAQVSRITVNFFLFGVGRSAQPPRPAADRMIDGRMQRRAQLPMIELHYLVSAWAGSTRDEHQLIGEILTHFILNQTLPAEHLPDTVGSAVQLAVETQDSNVIQDLWSTLGGSIKPCFELVATTAIDALPFATLPPPVERIKALVAPHRGPGS